jgi:glucokinase
VSVERVVSGPGLVDLYTYLDENGAAPTSDAMRHAVAQQGARAVGLYGVSEQGDAACQLAVRRFVSLYGAHAGDAALGLLPSGGVVVAGGIALALLPVMREAFMPAFLAKGRLTPALSPLRVEVALAADTGLRGAACLAQELATK